LLARTITQPGRELMIEAVGLQKKYGTIQALAGVSFRAEPGEVLAYLGPNGAGKSTTVKILTGLQRADAGTAWIEGFDIVQEPTQAKRQLGLVPESGALYEALTPVEYLHFVGELYEIELVRRRERIAACLGALRLEDAAWTRRMTGFSKGMKQRVLIAAALLHEPRVLFFDEPLNGLDVDGTVRVKELIAEQASRGCTILYCSHLLDVVERICSRIIILAEGQIRLQGSLQQIRADHPGSTLEQIFQKHTAPHVVGANAVRALTEPAHSEPL
jgi:ABC-2 type transport system ATP-binding protein